MADYILYEYKNHYSNISCFLYLNSMTTHITFAKNYVNIVTVFVCGYQSPSFKTTNNIATLQKFKLSTVNTGMTLIGIY